MQDMIMNRCIRYLPLFILLILVCIVLFADPSWADEPQTGFVKDIGNTFHAKSIEYGAKLKGYALSLFRLFLLIGIVVFGVQAALSRADMGDIIKEFLVMLLFAAFCYAAIIYYQDWTRYILDHCCLIDFATDKHYVKGFQPITHY